MHWTKEPLAFRLRPVAALPLGAASVAAFAPLAWFPLIFLTLGGLFALLDRSADENKGWRGGAMIGGAFGAGFFLTGVSWIYVSLGTFGGMPMLTAGLATVFFCLCMALYPALACGLFVRFAPAPGWRRILFFAALWTLCDWLRGWFLTGFPWLVLGYSQTPPSPLAGFAPLAGVYGVSLLTAIAAASIPEACRRQGCRAGLLASVAFFIAGGLLLGHPWTSRQGDPLSVTLLQGNIAQNIKWQPERFEDSLRAYYHLMNDNPAQLTILPEAALPVFLHDVPEEYLDILQTLAAREKGDLLFGIVIDDGGQRYTNSAVSYGASGTYRYNKSHLVPFGEFTPPGFAWFMAMVYIPMSDFTRGSAHQPLMRIGGMNVALNICYEDAFGEEIIRALPEATLLVNISNVAWFGDSLAPMQHFQIARMRALETGRMMLRATNTGITAIIDADGSVRGALPAYTRAALNGEIHAYTGSTPYVRWGNWPIITVSICLLAFARRRKALC